MFAPDTQVACKKRFANVSRHIVAPKKMYAIQVQYAIIFRRCASSCACGRASIALWRPAKAETVSCCQWLAAHGRDKLLNPFTATGRIYTSPKRPSRWPRTYIYVPPQFRFYAFVKAPPPAWLLLHVSKVSSSSVR